jgi:7-cyano-7-deazaguanine synthase in queuosine biosynthesis
MKDVCISREFNVNLKSDYYLRSAISGKSNESRVSADFGVLEPYVSTLELDLGYIASGLFACEGLLRGNVAKLDGSVTFVVENNVLNNANVKNILEEIMSFTLKVRPEVRIVRVTRKRPRNPEKHFSKKYGSCSLFSGGVDSLSGITQAHRKIGSTAGLFVSHDHTMGTRVNFMQTHFLKARNIPLCKITIQRGHKGLQQLRGLVYLVYGAVTARMLNTNKVVVSETGQTMYLPQFTALDEVTLTTHPTLIRMVKSLLREAYNSDFEFYEPFGDLTKAEVIALCDLKNAIPDTNSCITTQFANNPVAQQCGFCYGCIVRRLSCLVAGVEDGSYAKDVLAKGVGDLTAAKWRGQTIRTSNLADLQILVRFARDIIENKIDDVSRFKINSFSKQEVYRRFALDVLSSLYLLYDKTKNGHNTWLDKYYRECKKDGIVTSEVAENRIAEVREQIFKPDFDFKI